MGNKKIGSILLLLSCIFISLAFGLLFQNKIVLEGAKNKNRSRRNNYSLSTIPSIQLPTIPSIPLAMSQSIQNSPQDLTQDEFKNYFENLITTDLSNNNTTLNETNKQKLKKYMDIFQPSIYRDCVKIILELKIKRVDKLRCFETYIILPNLDSNNTFLTELNKIIDRTDLKNWEKIKEITNYNS